MKTIADKIRSMNNEEMAKFIWRFSINQTTSFFDDKVKGMNAREIKQYLKQYLVSDEFYESYLSTNERIMLYSV